MAAISPETTAVRPASRASLTAVAAIVLSTLLGLCGGYLDLLITVLSKYCWNKDGYFRNAPDFPWTIPAGHALLLLIPGLVVAALNAPLRGRISVRTGLWLFASLSIWGALLRAPINAVCSLLLAVGLARVIADHVAARGLSPRRLRYTATALLGLLGVLAACSSGWQALREYRAIAGLPPAPSPGRNVILIVWDTVRAYNVSSYGSHRDTTPNLSRWARQGVQYNHAVAPAPWTYPSHCCIMTGQWPYRLNSQWKFTLEGPDPTLAEYLAARGYQTAGFVANTNCCTYETGLARGFAHFEDYPLSPRALLSRTVPGKWILKQFLTLGAYYDPRWGAFYDTKWAAIQSRGAREINDGFFDWLSRRRSDRPFFAFLNYFDAHDPYVPPAGYDHRFGSPPRTRRDYQFLFDYVNLIKRPQQIRELRMALDCYNDCISFLDDQLDQLLGQLRGQGLLENTTVIITSDHGEGFGEHGFFGHAFGTCLDETGVPLVILSPGAPAGKEVDTAVSLRDLPATVVDLLALEPGSRFPGRSLAVHWRPARSSGVAAEETSPAFSEQADWALFEPNDTSKPRLSEFQMSLMADGRHYTRDGLGNERLFDVTEDPFEIENLAQKPKAEKSVAVFRKMLLDFLIDNPASAEVDRAYLKHYREELRAAVLAPGPKIASDLGRSP